MDSIRVKFNADASTWWPCKHQKNSDALPGGWFPACASCWNARWRTGRPAWVIDVALEWEGIPVLMSSWTVDPANYIANLDPRWSAYVGHKLLPTGGKREAQFIASRLNGLRERDCIWSLRQQGIPCIGAGNAFFPDDATTELLGTYLLTFRSAA